MSLLTRRSERRGDYLNPEREIWSRRRGTSSSVSDEKASTMMAVWRCQHLLADLVSGLPIDQFRSTPTGVRQEISPQADFVRRPSQFVRPKEWRYQLMLSALSVGNGYPFVTEVTPNGRVRHAEVLDPIDVRVERPGGALAPPSYWVKNRKVDAERVLHFRAYGPSPGSVLGLSPIAYAASSIKLGLGSREQMSKWHDKGGHPTALLRNENDITKDDAQVAKERYRAAIDGDDLLVLGGQWNLEAAQLAPDDATFLATSNASAVDVCGFFGIPPEMIGIANAGQSVTYANREQRALDLLVYTVQWWVGRVEDLISEQLPEGEFVKLNLNALLRSDALTRWKIHDTAIRVGARSPDEARMLEDEAPIPGDVGGQFLWPPYSTIPTPMEVPDAPND